MLKNRWLQTIIGVSLGVLLLWWLFRDTDWGEVWSATRRADPIWLAIGVAIIVVSFFTRVKRWSYIVRAGGPASYRSMFSATQIGFLANFTLPGRVGEVVRALVLTRLTHIRFSKSFAMVALDRVTDLVGLITVMLVAMFAFRPEHDIILPPNLYNKPIPADIVRHGAIGTAVFLCGVVGALVVVYLNRALVQRIAHWIVSPVSETLAEHVHGLIEQFAQGLHVFRSTTDMAKAIFFSLITWFTFLASYTAIMMAFGLSPPWYTPFVVVSLLAVATSIPGAPGFVGQFHFAMVVAAKVCMPELAVPEAKAIAILAHLLNLIPIAATGIFCLFREDLRFGELTRTGVDIEG